MDSVQSGPFSFLPSIAANPAANGSQTMWVAILLAALIVFIFLTVSKSQRKKLPPVAKLGTMPIIGTAMKYSQNPVDTIVEAREKYGDVFTLNLLLVKLTYAFGDEALKWFFSSKEDELSLGHASRKFTGVLLGPPDPRHVDKYDASHIMKALSMPNLKRFGVKSSKIVKQTVQRWIEKGRIDLFQECSYLVTSINVACFVGNQTLANHGPELAQIFADLEHYGTDVKAMIFPTSARKKAAECRENFCSIVTEEVQRIKDDRTTNKDEDHDFSWLDVLMETRPDDPAKSLSSTLLGMFFAAHTNTASTLFWTVANVFANRSILEKVRAELGTKASDEEDVMYNKMQYLDQCLKETVRKYALYMLFRKVMQDGVKIGGYDLPVGNYLCVSPRAVHLDANLFPNPESYNPDNFSPEKMAQNNNYHMKYIQWGYGSHRCLGEKFATLILRQTLLLLISQCDLEIENKELPPPNHAKSLGMSGPLHEVVVTVKSRV